MTAAETLTPAPFNARGLWPDRSITRPVSPPGMLRGQQPYERARGTAGGLARRVCEMGEHRITRPQPRLVIEQDFVY